MTRGFIKYFLILFVFFICATGLVPALLQKPGSNHHASTSIHATSHNSLREAVEVRAVITRPPLSGNERRTVRFLADENEVEEDYLSRKGISKYTSSGAAFAVVFQPSLTILRRLFLVSGSIPDGLFNKVYLLIQVFRI